jgi:hypothetical protein
MRDFNLHARIYVRGLLATGFGGMRSGSRALTGPACGLVPWTFPQSASYIYGGISLRLLKPQKHYRRYEINDKKSTHKNYTHKIQR